MKCIFITRLALSVLSLILTACSVGVLNVQSSPEGADVYLQAGTQQPSRIGKTPLNISSNTVNNLPVDSFKIQLRKEGYSPETFVVPKVMFSSSIDISTKLNEDSVPDSCKDQNAAIERIVRSVATVQFNIQQKKYDQASRLLSTLIAEYPTTSVLYDLQGNVFYLQKNLDAALDSYSLSLKINPNNPQTQRMVNKLQVISGRVPSSGGN